MSGFAKGMLPDAATNKITVQRVFSQASPREKLEHEKHKDLMRPQSEYEIRHGIERTYGIIDNWDRIKVITNYLRAQDTIWVPSTNDSYPTFPVKPPAQKK